MSTFRLFPPAAPLRAARLAVAAVFFLNGVLVASWVLHIPTVKARLGLSEGVLGLALLSVAVGALLAMPPAGWLAGRWGSSRVTRLFTFLYLLTLPVPVLAPRLAVLIPALLLFGMANAVMDIAMNAHAVVVEKRYDRPIMSSFHGMWSLGGFVGAALGGAALSMGAPPALHVGGVLVLMALLGGVALPYLLPASVDAHGRHPAHRFRLIPPRGPLVALGLLAGFVLLSEGAMADWTAVYLRETLGTGPGLASAGFAAFSMAMAVGRFTGDRLVAHLGAVRLMRASALLAAGGLGAGLLLHHPAAAVAGFGCVGLGLANMVPILFSAAGRTPGISAGTALAAVTSTGYVGFLAGPPLIGFAAEVVTLPGALGLLVLFCLVVARYAPLVGQTAPAGG